VQRAAVADEEAEEAEPMHFLAFNLLICLIARALSS
jgi:hypothetical protein